MILLFSYILKYIQQYTQVHRENTILPVIPCVLARRQNKNNETPRNLYYCTWYDRYKVEEYGKDRPHKSMRSHSVTYYRTDRANKGKQTIYPLAAGGGVRAFRAGVRVSCLELRHCCGLSSTLMVLTGPKTPCGIHLANIYICTYTPIDLYLYHELL